MTPARRLALAATGAALAAASFGAATAHAEPEVEPVQVHASDYLACAGVDTVGVAVCVPRPDVQDYPPPRRIIRDLTGIG